MASIIMRVMPSIKTIILLSAHLNSMTTLPCEEYAKYACYTITSQCQQENNTAFTLSSKSEHARNITQENRPNTQSHTSDF